MTNFKLRGNDFYDSHNHKLAVIRGTDIFDEHNHKIATISDIKKQIDGAYGGIAITALWIYFVR